MMPKNTNSGSVKEIHQMFCTIIDFVSDSIEKSMKVLVTWSKYQIILHFLICLAEFRLQYMVYKTNDHLELNVNHQA